MADPPKVVIIPQDELRVMFNELRLWELALQGKLRQDLLWEGTPQAAVKAKEPNGTKSQIVRYTDRTTHRMVAEVHQYLRPDGTIGASGLPDPKRVVETGVVYTCISC